MSGIPETIVEADNAPRTSPWFEGLIRVFLLRLSLGVVFALDGIFGRENEKLRLLKRIQSIGEIENRDEIVFDVTLENRSDRPVMILGSSWICREAGCIAYDGPPQSIPPSSQGTVRLRLIPSSTANGDFRLPVDFYTDCEGQPTLTVDITGHIIASDQNQLSDRK